jgi:hypothetical protein
LIGPLVLVSPTNSANALRRGGGFGGSGWTNNSHNAYPANVPFCQVGAHTTVATDTANVIVSVVQAESSLPELRKNKERTAESIRTEKELGYHADKWPDSVALVPFLVVGA